MRPPTARRALDQSGPLRPPAPGGRRVAAVAAPFAAVVAAAADGPLQAAALVAGCVAVVAVARTRGLAVSGAVVAALMPWVAAGAAAAVVGLVVPLPDTVAPLVRVPVVYLTALLLGGATWLVVHWLAQPGRVTRASPTWWVPALVAACGTAALAAGTVATAVLSFGRVDPLWPLGSVLAAVVGTVVVWRLLAAAAPRATLRTRWLGVAVVFGHTLDGTSTLVGVDVLGFAERSLLPQYVLGAAAVLPTATVLGTAWLFVLLKLVLAVAIVVTVGRASYESPASPAVVLGVSAGAGLAPGAHNVFLFVLV